MSTPLKWLVMLLLWFLFCVITFKACVQEACCDPCVTTTEETTPPPPAETSPERFPIDFQWDNAKPFTNEGFDALRTRLVNEMGPDNQLIITGRYFASEGAPEGFASMGVARAERIKAMLAAFIPAERIITTDLRLDDKEEAKTNYFEAVDFEWQTPDAKEESEVVEIDNQVIVRFPFSSATKEPDPRIDEYFDKLAERLKQTTERVEIIGHTDNVGSEGMNMNLSERRAKFVRDILRRKGISADRMVIDWKGESDPRSSNETAEGRHNNRRVELRILEN
jgi:outer membrane protein OmpA-like peptidoglycan-associated protein